MFLGHICKFGYLTSLMVVTNQNVHFKFQLETSTKEDEAPSQQCSQHIAVHIHPLGPVMMKQRWSALARLLLLHHGPLTGE